MPRWLPSRRCARWTRRGIGWRVSSRGRRRRRRRFGVSTSLGLAARGSTPATPEGKRGRTRSTRAAARPYPRRRRRSSRDNGRRSARRLRRRRRMGREGPPPPPRRRRPSRLARESANLAAGGKPRRSSPRPNRARRTNGTKRCARRAMTPTPPPCFRTPTSPRVFRVFIPDGSTPKLTAARLD